MADHWVFLGEGSFNRAYRSRDGKLVLKIQKDKDTDMDDPARSVRLWNEINHDLDPRARLVSINGERGWVCPFVEGVQASDREMSEALVDIYNRTGRIVVDATAAKNFVKTPPPDSKVLCVDVGMALQMERREENLLLSRRKSVVSLHAWHTLNRAYNPFFQQCSATYPQTVRMVKAMLFIKSNRPDIFDVNFLKEEEDLIEKLARAFDGDKLDEAIENLDELTPKSNVASAVALAAVSEGVPETNAPVQSAESQVSTQASRAQTPAQREAMSIGAGVSDPLPVSLPNPLAHPHQRNPLRDLGPTPPEVRVGKTILRDQRPLTLDNLKESITVELERYIHSRGRVNAEGVFEPSLMTRFFRNVNLTQTKVAAAREIINNIAIADSLHAINMELMNRSGPILNAGRWTRGYEAAIRKCQLMTSIARNEPGLRAEAEVARP